MWFQAELPTYDWVDLCNLFYEPRQSIEQPTFIRFNTTTWKLVVKLHRKLILLWLRTSTSTPIFSLPRVEKLLQLMKLAYIARRKGNLRHRNMLCVLCSLRKVWEANSRIGKFCVCFDACGGSASRVLSRVGAKEKLCIWNMTPIIAPFFFIVRKSNIAYFCVKRIGEMVIQDETTT